MQHKCRILLYLFISVIDIHYGDVCSVAKKNTNTRTHAQSCTLFAICPLVSIRPIRAQCTLCVKCELPGPMSIFAQQLRKYRPLNIHGTHCNHSLSMSIDGGHWNISLSGWHQCWRHTKTHAFLHLKSASPHNDRSMQIVALWHTFIILVYIDINMNMNINLTLAQN